MTTIQRLKNLEKWLRKHEDQAIKFKADTKKRLKALEQKNRQDYVESTWLKAELDRYREMLQD